MQRRTLGDFGFGCAGIAGLYQLCPEVQAMATLDAAWTSGIRYFDTAPFYGTGLSERRLGQFLQGKPRDQVVVSSKVGRLLTPVPAGTAPDYGFVGADPALVHFDYSHDGIMRSIDASLQRLGLDRLDVAYVHDIGGYTHGPAAAGHMADLMGSGLAALTGLQAQGVIGGWGLGVNETAICLQVMENATPDLILLAGRYSLLDRRAEAALLPELRRAGVPLVIGGVFNSGILATGAVVGARFDYDIASPDILHRVAGMGAVCAAAGTKLTAAALQFPLQEPTVATVLLGNSDPATLRRNLADAKLPVPPEVYADTRGYALT